MPSHPEAEHMTVLDRFSRAIAGPWFRICHRFQTHGTEHVPPAGPVIFAANHQSYYDPVLLSLAASRHIIYMGLKKFFSHPLLGRIIRAYDCVPVRENPRSATAYRALLRALQHGHAVGIFPEGGRTLDGLITPPRPGVGALAINSGAPVVPVTIDGAYDAWPAGQSLPRPAPIQLVFGAPISFSPKKTARNTSAVREEVTQTIMLRIAAGFHILGRPVLADRSRRNIERSR